MISPTWKWIDEKSLPGKWRPGGAERELFEMLFLKDQTTPRVSAGDHKNSAGRCNSLAMRRPPKKSSGCFIRKLKPWEYPAPPPEAPKKILVSPPKLYCQDGNGGEIPLKRFLEKMIHDAIQEQTGRAPERVEWPMKFSRIEIKTLPNTQKAEVIVRCKDRGQISLMQSVIEATREQFQRELKLVRAKKRPGEDKDKSEKLVSFKESMKRILGSMPEAYTRQPLGDKSPMTLQYPPIQ
jgi:hypothetical protein